VPILTHAADEADGTTPRAQWNVFFAESQGDAQM
jgi:hypothetical protein